MNPAFATLLVVKATLVLAAAFAVARALRSSSAASRHLVWITAFAALLLVPLLAFWAPLEVAVLPPPVSSEASPSSELTSSLGRQQSAAAGAPMRLSRGALPPSRDAGAADAVARGAGTRAGGAHGGTAREVPPSEELTRELVTGEVVPSDLSAVLVALWGAVALAVALSLAGASLAVRRIVRSAQPVAERDWLAALHDVSDRLGLAEPPRLLRSDAVKMPFACGVARPTIVLPAESEGWTPECRRAVLVHELGHIGRHDLVSHTLARLLCAAWWFHPLVWVAAKRLRAESERACDDLALALGVRAPDYAGHLLDVIASARTQATPVAALAMARRDDIEGRLLDILDPDRVRTIPSRRQAATVAGLFALIALIVGAAAPVSAAAEASLIAGSAVDTRALGGSAAQVTSPQAIAAHGTADGSGVTAGEPGANQTATAISTSTAALTALPQPDATLSSSSAPALPPATSSGDWAIRLAGPDEAVAAGAEASDGPVVHVALRTPGLNTFYLPLAQFDGLDAASISAPDALGTFRLRRDAGTFTFDGRFRNGRGTGRFEFAPDPAFAEALARRNIGRPSADLQFSLARHDVDLAFIDELAAQGYARPTLEDLDRAGMSSVDLRYVREMGALGYRLGTVDALLRLSNHSITPESVRKTNARLGRQASPEELLAERMGGDARASRSTGVASPSTFVPSSSAVSPAPTQRPASFIGSTPLEGRWVIDRPQGAFVDLELFWTDSTNWHRRISTSAFSDISLNDVLASAARSALARFRIEQDAGTFEFEGSFQPGRGSGTFRFNPNRHFAVSMRAIGLEGSDTISDHDLKNLAWGGISAADVRAFQSLGFPRFGFKEAVELSIFFVTPEYVSAMQRAGVAEARTVSGAIDLRRSGLTAEYVRELADLGYPELSSRQLIEMMRARVTPAMIRELRQSGERELTPAELIRRARGGGPL